MKLRVAIGFACLAVLLVGSTFAAEVTVHQDRIQVYDSTVIVPLTVTLNGEPLGAEHAGFQLSNADVSLDEVGPVPGAPAECGDIYTFDSQGNLISRSEQRYLIQRVANSCETTTQVTARLLFVFDLSGSVNPGPQLQIMNDVAADLVQRLLAGGSPFEPFEQHGGAVNVGWFAGDLSRIQQDGVPPTVANYRTNVPELLTEIRQESVQNVDNAIPGAATALNRAGNYGMQQLLLAQTEAIDADPPDDCGSTTQALKILVFFTDGTETTEDPTSLAAGLLADIAALATAPDWMFMALEVAGDNNASVMTQLGEDFYAPNVTSTAYNGEIVNLIQDRLVGLNPDDPGAVSTYGDYVLYYCTQHRVATLTGTAINRATLALDLNGLDGTAQTVTFDYEADEFGSDTSLPGPIRQEGCFLWQFDEDMDCYYRVPDSTDYDDLVFDDEFQYDGDTDGLGVDSWTGQEFASFGLFDVGGECCVGVWEISSEDTDCSGCIPSAADCAFTPPELLDDCGKFGRECDVDPSDGDTLTLGADLCRDINPGEQEDELLPFEPICEDSGDAAADPAREVCGNGIDEDCDGADLECPQPPLLTGEACQDTVAGPLTAALSRDNVFVLPRVRHDAGFTTDLTIIAKGPSYNDDIDLDFDQCCFAFNCDLDPIIPGNDAYCCDVNNDGIPDADCVVELPWVEIYYLPSSSLCDGSSPVPAVGCNPQSVKLCLGSDGMLHIEDVLGTYFGVPAGTDASGALVVSSAWVTEVEASARTYFQGGGGTYGELVPAIPKSVWLNGSVDGRSEARLIHLTGPCISNMTTTFGIVNLECGTPVTFDVQLFHADGSRISSQQWSVQPGAPVTVCDLLPCGSYDAYATVTVSPLNASVDHSFIAWASVVDNATNDPSFITDSNGHQAPADGTRLFIPEVARVAGADPQQGWFTDVEIANLNRQDSGDAAAIEFFLMNDDPNNTHTVRQLMPGMAYRLIDIIGELPEAPEQPLGTLVIQVTEGGLAANARTYRLDVLAGTTATSTFGEAMNAVPENQLFGTGRKVYLLGQDGALWNTKMWIVNPTDDSLDATVRYFNANGVEVGSEAVVVGEGIRKRLFSAPTDLGIYYATIEITGGSGRCFAYAQVEDNATKDVMLLVAR